MPKQPPPSLSSHAAKEQARREKRKAKATTKTVRRQKQG